MCALEAAREYALAWVDRLEVLDGLIRRHPDWSDTRLAKLSATHRQTVKKVRDDLEARGVIERVSEVIREDGTPYPYRRGRLK